LIQDLTPSPSNRFYFIDESGTDTAPYHDEEILKEGLEDLKFITTEK